MDLSLPCCCNLQGECRESRFLVRFIWISSHTRIGRVIISSLFGGAGTLQTCMKTPPHRSHSVGASACPKTASNIWQNAKSAGYSDIGHRPYPWEEQRARCVSSERLIPCPRLQTFDVALADLDAATPVRTVGDRFVLLACMPFITPYPPGSSWRVSHGQDPEYFQSGEFQAIVV
jgi:hypothetical protein